MELADYPVKKCILTGTPIPNNPTDAFQYLDFYGAKCNFRSSR